MSISIDPTDVLAGPMATLAWKRLPFPVRGVFGIFERPPVLEMDPCDRDTIPLALLLVGG